MGFPRQEIWRGLPFPSPGDLPNPGIDNNPPPSPAPPPALAGRFFTTEPPGKKNLSSPPNISFHIPWKTLVPQVLMSL